MVLRDVPGPPAFTRPHFTLVVGLQTGTGSEIGALLLGIDPAVALYRSILAWPASRTGDLVLVRRDDDAVVYLSPVRYSPGASMAMREALAGQPTPIARAVFEGTHVEGDDTSGKKVLTWARPIPDSSWFVVAKIDRDEAYEPLGDLAVRLLEIGGMLVLMCGVGVTRGGGTNADARSAAPGSRDRAPRAHSHYEFLTHFGNDAILP